MSESVGSTPFNAYGSYPPPDAAGGDGGPGGTSYDAWNNAVAASGGSGSGGTSNTAATPSKPPAVLSDPKTGREAPDAQIEFQTWDGYTGAVGTPQQLLDQLPALLRYNDARAKSASLVSGGTPVPKLPGGYTVQFDSTADLQNYLTRSAAPVVPTGAVAATFQSVLGRGASDPDVALAESSFNAGKTLADYRAGLVSSPEVANTLQGISRQVLGRDATPTELAADKGALGAGTSMDALRFGLAHSAEATADVTGLFGSVLGQAASGLDITDREAQLTAGGSLDAVWQDLAGSPEAHNEVAAAFEAELGRDAPDPNIFDMQHSLAAPGGSIDGVRSFLASTLEAGTNIIALYQYGVGQAPTAPELTAAQGALAQNGSLRDTYQSLGGIAGAGLVGNADQFGAVLRQVDLLGGGAQSAGQRALQGVLSWAARNGPALGAGGVAGAILLT